MKHQIRLRGVGGDYEGKVWESASRLQIGRQESLEIVIEDTSVSRRHAELRVTEQGWRVRDLRSTNGTFLNGNNVGTKEWPLRLHDILRCGNITLVVEALQFNRDAEPGVPDEHVVEATACFTWEDALNGLAFDADRCPRPGEQLLALLRAGHYLGHVETIDELLQAVLNDAVAVLDAQRGAIVLAEEPDNTLRLRALASGRLEAPSRPGFSKNLAQRSFQRGESILCHRAEEDPELAMAQSIADGAMASVLCVLLRTPRKPLGVLHLDRGPWQKPFTREDLHLADGLAANVSAGIESAQLLQKQRDLFLKTITILAQAVELRDEYTGGHTARVSTYALLLAEHLNLSATDLHLIRIGTPLHDIGKIGIPDDILRKPGRLTPEETQIMQTHTVKGAAILSTIPDLAPVVPIARSHHERWDGRGYPDALAGKAISRLARIVAVADAFDAMTSDRPYRRGMPAEVAFTEVKQQSGKQFDPECATAFLAIREQVLRELTAHAGKITTLTEELAALSR